MKFLNLLHVINKCCRGLIKQPKRKVFVSFASTCVHLFQGGWKVYFIIILHIWVQQKLNITTINSSPKNLLRGYVEFPYARNICLRITVDFIKLLSNTWLEILHYMKQLRPIHLIFSLCVYKRSEQLWMYSLWKRLRLVYAVIRNLTD